MNQTSDINQYERYHMYEEIAAALHDRGYFSIMPSHVEEAERALALGREPSSASGLILVQALRSYAQPGINLPQRADIARDILETKSE